MKICTKCNKEKSVSEFYFKKNRNSYESSCKKCRQLSVKNYLEKNNNLKKIFYTRVRNILKRYNRRLEKKNLLELGELISNIVSKYTITY